MNDIAELERRITAALDRIGAGIEGLARPAPATPPQPEEDGPVARALLAELETEREVTAQLEERVRAIKDKQDTRLAQMEADLEIAAERLAAVEEDRRRLKHLAAALRQSNQALREANEAGLADPQAIDTAMRIELDALRGLRESDRAELDDILGALAPVLEQEAADA
ncbi:MAG: hypothetical protein ACU0AT_14125 [Tranquillimonas sp.]|jgi:small-conductance mechanosensitive channel